MNVYVVSGEAFVPHAEFNGNLGVFHDLQSALNFIEKEYENTMIGIKTDPGYFSELCEDDEHFGDYPRYIYCKEGYYYTWKFEKFELE